MKAALETFRRFAADYSRAQRAYENAMATAPERADDALARKQEIEREFCACFALVRRPGNSGGGA